MSRYDSRRLTWFIAGLGALATLGVVLAYGWEAGASTAVGAVVALGNWFLLRLIVDRVIGGTLRRQAGLTFLLVVKMFALIGLVFVLLRSGVVQVLPFTLGITSLMAGAILGSFVHVLTAPAVESER